MMMSQHQPMDIPTTIFCRLDEVEQSEDFTTDDLCSSVRSSISDCCHFDNMNNNLDMSRKSSTTTITSPYDNRAVTNQDLRNMKHMVASMRQNPELLNISPVMQRACLTSSSNSKHRQRQRRCTTDGIPPRLIVPDKHDYHHHNHHVDIAANNNDAAVKNEDLNAMKHMVASMRKNPLLLYQSPIMQRACLTTTTTTTTSVDNTTAALTTTTNNDISSPKPISPVELRAAWNNSSSNVGRRRRPLGGTRYDPSTFPSLPLSSVSRRGGVHSIVDNDVKVPSSAVAVVPPPAPPVVAATFVVAPSSLSREVIKINDSNTSSLSRRIRPRSI